MKLLCDVCENDVASLICCADEAALCLSCDSRVHAANKLASKHQRMPLLSEASEPAVCDICQEEPSFFFCIEDRALLCRECDTSIHSANTLAAKHRRFLLTGIQIGVNSNISPSKETASAISSEQHMPGTSRSPPTSMAVGAKKPFKQAVMPTSMNCGNNTGGFSNMGEMSNQAARKSSRKAAATMRKAAATTKTLRPSKDNAGVSNIDLVVSKEACSSGRGNKTSDQAGLNAKSLQSCTINKQGTFFIPSSTDNTGHRKEAGDSSSSNSTTISIRRISVGRVPFVAPVLSTLHAALMQEGASNKVNDNINVNTNNIKGNTSNDMNNSSSNGVMVDVEKCLPAQSENMSDYLTSGILGWRFDELLTDLVGMCESGPSLSPPKESSAPGLGIQEDPLWYAELDFMEETELSASQEESVALVPEMPSPPTASGLVTSCGKLTCPAAQHWSFDYLFTGPHQSNEFSVVPDIDGHRSSPISMASLTRDSIGRKRKAWFDV